MTTRVKLQRSYQSDDVTLGMLQIEDIDHDPIYTLENPDIDNKPYISCIPAGDYVCYKHNGAKFKDVWIVREVMGRSDILIHQGNTESDTSGCILVGMKAGHLHGNVAVLNSHDALDLMREKLGKKEFILHVRDK